MDSREPEALLSSLPSGHRPQEPSDGGRGGGSDSVMPPLVRRDPAFNTESRDAQRVPTSWEEVARDYGQMLYAVAFRLTGNDDDARDLVQDVLIKVNRSLAQFRPGSFTGWLYRITFNTFLDNVRRRQRVRLQPIPDDDSRMRNPEASPEPLDVLDRARLDAELQAAVNELPSEFKAAVVMCDVVGMSYQEIADQLGVAIGTVRSRIHRGRAILKKRLAHRIGSTG